MFELAPEQVEPFVRNVLGCGCPDEVFEQVELEDRTGQGLAYQCIRVGGRLLVYLADLPGSPGWEGRLEQLIVQGLRERDQRCYNRFRLVLPACEGLDEQRTLDLFTRLTRHDETAHLHLVPGEASRGGGG